MSENKLLNILKSRERNFTKLTEQALRIFIVELRDAVSKELYNNEPIELFLFDVSILPQNFRFARVEGKINTYDIGDKIETENGDIEITLENFWDFSKTFSIIAPMSLLDEPDVDMLCEYLRQVKDNSDKIPESILQEYNISDTNGTNSEIGEFAKIDKELDELQLMALKLTKNVSVH